MRLRIACFGLLTAALVAPTGADPNVVRARLEWEPGTVGGYHAQSVDVSADPPDGVAALLHVEGALYGAAEMGDVRPLLVAVTAAADSPRLWVDSDMDGDLSDERETPLKRSGSTLSADVSVRVPVSADTVPVPVEVHLERVTTSDSAPVTLYPKAYRTGEVVLAGRLRRIALVDENADLRFDDAKRDVFYVDVDGDETFASGHGTHEHFHFGSPINVGGLGFDVRIADAVGSGLDFYPVAEIPEPQPRSWKTTRYAGPGREQTPPSDDLATLLERFREETGKTYSERTSTIAAIGRTGAPEAVAFLLQVADGDDDNNMRSAAVRALGNPAYEKKAAPRLVKLAKGGDAALAAAAIQALYDAGYDGREALFVDLLSSSQTSVVSAAARYLSYEGTDTGRAAILRACATAATPALRYQAYNGARTLPGGPPPEVMLRAAGEDYPALQARALEDMSLIGHPESRRVALELAEVRPIVLAAGLAVARVLGSDDTPGSAEAALVIGAAGDERVRNEVVKRVATVRSEHGLREVLSLLKAKDPAVRTITAQVLAGIPEPYVTEELAARAKREKDEVVLSAMVEALGDHGDPAHVKLLIAATKKKRYDILRTSAIRALARLGLEHEEVREFFLKLLASKVWQDRIFAIDAAGASGDLRLVDELLPLLGHERRQVRLATVQALRRLRSGDAVKALIDRLAEEDLQRIRNELATALFVTTGVNLYDEHALWQQWWSDHGGNFAVPGEIPRLPEADAGGTAASFYGIAIDSDRVSFVIDQSGSMSAADTSGLTAEDKDALPNRLDAAVREVLRALTQLDEQAYANVVLFHSTIQPWKDELVRMTKHNRAELSKHLLEQRPTGGTNLYDGLEQALLDPEVDTILLLSDGVPGAGKYTSTGDILRAVRRVNQTRRVVIHCVSLGRDSDLMQKLAAENSGKYVRR